MCDCGWLTSQATQIFLLLCLVPLWLHLCKYGPFYINPDCNVWRFGTAAFESTLKVALPTDAQSLGVCKMCVCFAVVWGPFMCAPCLERVKPRDISNATTVPVSHIPLKNHVDSDKPLLSLLLSLPPFTLAPWDGLKKTFTTRAHHPQQACLIFHFPPFFLLYFTILNHLSPQQTATRKLSIQSSKSMAASRVVFQQDCSTSGVSGEILLVYQHRVKSFSCSF